MTNYIYRIAAIILLLVSAAATFFYKLSIDAGVLKGAQLVEITGGLLSTWMIAIVLFLISIAEAKQNSHE